ncbi:hypothetical protein [Halofilum ochraceum]|uniref:hypothetical protein n=1 Tax=Halofilum ochraceum TaxID=1611323 RepID=UPI001113134A|nr:hypothetical protein [Halofilum ochraceum]
MATIDTHIPATTRTANAGQPAAEGLGDITVRRDALQASARAAAFLLTVRTVRRGIAALRARQREH